MKGTTRSIIGSIIIIFVIAAIVTFTNEDEKVDTSATINKTSVKQMENMPVDGMPPGGTQADDTQAGEKMIPQFATDACVDLAEGDTCTMLSPRGEESGVCALEDGDTLACKPDRAMVR